MKKFISILFMTAGLISIPALACDQTEADNMCKTPQVFDPSSGECKNTSV
jgi:hypothetical protein